MVVQMLTNMNKMADSSCSTIRLIFRPQMFSMQMFNGTTGGTEEERIRSVPHWNPNISTQVLKVDPEHTINPLRQKYHTGSFTHSGK